MDTVFRSVDLRLIMQELFPDVEDDRDDNADYEHPMTAVGIVLLSAAIMGTVDASRLALFSGYSRQFISGIAVNMQNNKLWNNGRYDTATWLSPDGTINGNALWEHIDVACGMLWMPAGDTNISVDTCGIYWDERCRR